MYRKIIVLAQFDISGVFFPRILCFIKDQLLCFLAKVEEGSSADLKWNPGNIYYIPVQRGSNKHKRKASWGRSVLKGFKKVIVVTSPDLCLGGHRTCAWRSSANILELSCIEFFCHTTIRQTTFAVTFL